ncbi:hypothetical protein F2Q69_00010963 [Brassica cretica]|uniref:Uncharacterized protein n=1 Tax=Brassica cretica TaxID=69181 RepID=A0A8S9R232_BRACR|nr:hypothetical protein F2Q69_00010963 [Brassica cretica]
MVTRIKAKQETFRSRFEGEHKDGGLTGRYVCVLGRYVATELCACSVSTSRPSCVRARSLRRDRAVCVLGRYGATELDLSLVATLQPSRVLARSLRSDRAV